MGELLGVQEYARRLLGHCQHDPAFWANYSLKKWRPQKIYPEEIHLLYEAANRTSLRLTGAAILAT